MGFLHLRRFGKRKKGPAASGRPMWGMIFPAVFLLFAGTAVTGYAADIGVGPNPPGTTINVTFNPTWLGGSSYTNNGTISINGGGVLQLAMGEILNNSLTGVLTINAGASLGVGGGTLNNYGAINNAGTLECIGTCTQNATATYSGNGEIFMQGTLTNTSNNALAINTLTFSSGSFVNNGAGPVSIGTVYIQYPGYNGTIQGNAISLATANVAGPLTVSSVITGAGSLTKTGGGTLTLTGANTYVGGTIINAGAIKVGSDGNLGDAAGALTFGGGTLQLSGSFTSNRSVTLNAGGGAFDTNGYGLTLSGGITGLGSLTKNGAGTLFLTGADTYTGATTINAGALSVNGSMTSPVTVNASGTLMGSGTITGDVTNGGTLAPGNSIGTLTIAGNYTHNAGATYQVEVNAAGQSDKLVVTGTATLNGGAVSVLAESGNYKLSTAYTILTAGSVVGTFGSVTSNLAFLTPTLSYDPTNVYLHLTRNDVRFADVALTANQRAVAAALDHTAATATGDMGTVVSTIFGLSAASARNAYDQMGGLLHTSLTEAAFSSFRRYIDTLNSRMGGFAAGGNPSLADAGFPLLASLTDVGSDAANTLLAALDDVRAEKQADPSRQGLWMRGYGSLGDRKGDDIASKYDYTNGGILAGFDRKIGESFLAGASVGYALTRVRMDGLAESGKVASYQGSLYGAWLADPWYVNAIAAYGYNRYDTTRDIAFSDINRTAHAGYGGHAISGYTEAGCLIRTDAVTIIPMASLQAGYLTRNGFTETDAGALNLNAEKDNFSSLIGSLGVKLRKAYRTAAGEFTPEVRARWLHEFGGSASSLNASFADSRITIFTVKGDEQNRDSANLGFTLSWETDKHFSLLLAYDANLSGDRADQSATAGVRYSW